VRFDKSGPHMPFGIKRARIKPEPYESSQAEVDQENLSTLPKLSFTGSTVCTAVFCAIAASSFV
jgi:hypothetical protein